MKREEKPWVNGKSKLVEFSTIMRCLLSTLTLLAIALPVNAQNWMMVPVLFADGSQLYIDSGSGLVLPESAGNEVLRSACLMPYTLTKPR